jgi:hypothetical protein
MPDWVHKTTKKYMTKDFMTVDLVKGNTQKTSATVEVQFISYRNYLIFIFSFD